MAYTPLVSLTRNLGKFKSIYPQPYQRSQQQLYKSPYGKIETTGGLTDYEQQLMSHVQESKQKFDWKQKLWQPIQLVFDILSRGQYMTANTAKQITENLRLGRPSLEGVAREAWQGISGKEKGDWKTVIFGGEDQGGEAFRGWAQDWGDQLEEKKGGRFLKGLIGIGANIVLDPTTWINPIPTRAATAAAKAYAGDQLVLEFAKRMTANFDDLSKVIKAGGNADDLAKAFAAGSRVTKNYMGQLGVDVPRMMDKAYKAAYRIGLRSPAGQLANDVAKQIETLQKTAWDNFLMSGKEIPTGATGDVLNLQGLLNKVQGVGEVPRYSGAGTRAIRVAGVPILEGERYPKILETWDRARDAFAKSKMGGFFSEAWWQTMGRPDRPFGHLKKLFNVKTPYEQFMSNIVLDQQAQTAHLIDTWGTNLAKVFKPYEKNLDELNIIKDVMYEAQKNPDFDFLAALANRGVQGDKASQAMKTIQDLRLTLDEWFQRHEKLVAPELGRDIGYTANYLPISYRSEPSLKHAPKTLGPKKAGWELQRNVTPATAESREASMLKFMFGFLSDDDAKRLVTEFDVTPLKSDLRELMFGRMLTQARLEQRASLIKQFKEFGINIGDAKRINPQVWNEVASGVGRVPGLELAHIQDAPELAEFVFDRQVAEILGRAVKISSSDAHIEKLWRGVSQFSGWWKAVATFSPGFDARNFMSNQITGLTKHGPSWLNPQLQFDAFVGTIYGLKGEEGAKALFKKMQIPGDTVEKMLSKRIGNKTMKELFDKAAQQGVVTRATQAFDVDQALEVFTKKPGWNLLNKRNVPFEFHHEISSVVESQSRLASFLIDYQAVTKGGGSPDAAFEWAKLEAKKWFIDYQDLSPFEQKYMKTIIPFYCVPEDTEILTREGYKLYDELNVGEEVLTYNIEQDIMEWQPLEDIAIFDYDDDLVHATGKLADFRFTSDHRFPIQVQKSFVKGKWYGGDRKIVRAYELNKSHSLILSAPSRHQDSLISPRHAAIIGWLVTDGYQRQRGNYLEKMIYQHPRKHAEEIRKLLGEYLSSESVHPDTGVICFRLNKMFPLNITKEQLPALVTRLSHEALEAMFDAMCKAEASNCKGNIQFTQKEGPVLDAFQIICQLLNKPFNYSYRTGYCTGYVRKRNRLKVAYLRQKKEHYCGHIWCPKTANSTWVMRQNGKVIITGNTWLRKNIANQISAMIDYREMYSMIPKIQKGMQGATPEHVPEYMRQEGYIPIREEGGIARMFWPNFPYMDINKIPIKFSMNEAGIPIPVLQPRELVNDLMNAAHPLLKTFVEIAPDETYHTFYRTVLGETTEAPAFMQWFNKYFKEHPKTVALLDGALRTVGVEKGLGFEQDRNGKMRINSRIARLLENNVLLLDRLDDYTKLPEYLIPAFDRMKTELQGKKPKTDYEKTELGLQVLAFYMGVKMRDIKEAEIAEREAREIMDEAEKLLKKKRQQEPGYQQRSLRAIQTQQRRMRKLGVLGTR